jgi:hypothetical protein
MPKAQTMQFYLKFDAEKLLYIMDNFGTFPEVSTSEQLMSVNGQLSESYLKNDVLMRVLAGPLFGISLDQ